MGTSVLAYTEGRKARLSGMQVGSNPYDPSSELSKYESWIDGWSSVDEE